MRSMRWQRLCLALCGTGCLLLTVVLAGYLLTGHAPIQLRIKYGNPDTSPAQKELLQFHSQLELGMTLEQVQKVFHKGCYTHLKLDIQKGRTLVIIHTAPSHFFAKGWMLGVQIQSDKTVGLRIRRHDSAHHMPKTAPADRIAAQAPPLPSWTATNVY